MIKARTTLKYRGVDDWGDGSFAAPRGRDSKGNKKSHKGIDFITEPGDEIYSPVKGRVSKVGYPYAPKSTDKIVYRYVEVTDYRGNRHRVFYIEPIVGMDRHVDTTTIIGLAQDIAGKFHHPERKPMKNHVHYEIFDANGALVNPEVFV